MEVTNMDSTNMELVRMEATDTELTDTELTNRPRENDALPGESSINLSVSLDQHNTKYRVRLIPECEQDEIKLFHTRLSKVLSLSPADIWIYSFSSSETPHTRTAIVSFLYIPDLLKDRKESLMISWQVVGLAVGPAVKSERISIDKDFIGWTNMSPKENDKQYCIE